MLVDHSTGTVAARSISGTSSRADDSQGMASDTVHHTAFVPAAAVETHRERATASNVRSEEWLGTQGHMDLGTASTRPPTRQFGWKMNQRKPHVREPGGRAFESTNLYAFKLFIRELQSVPPRQAQVRTPHTKNTAGRTKDNTAVSKRARRNRGASGMHVLCVCVCVCVCGCVCTRQFA